MGRKSRVSVLAPAMGTLVAAGKAPDLHAGRRSGASVRSETLSEKPKENKRELFAGSLNSGEEKKKKKRSNKPFK